MKSKKHNLENPNDHKVKTPSTKNKKDDRHFTSYDTSKKETSTPQQVREGRESASEQKRKKES